MSSEDNVATGKEGRSVVHGRTEEEGNRNKSMERQVEES